MSSSGSQGTQCVHQDFLRILDMDKLLAERIQVRIPGHTRWILGCYLHDMFQSWHSSFIAMTQLENHILQSCLTVSALKIFGLSNLD
jgi:hypothetical protein